MTPKRLSPDLFLKLLREEIIEESRQDPDLSVDEAMQSPLARKALEAISASSTAAESRRTEPGPSPVPAGWGMSRAIIAAALQDTFDLAALNATQAERDALSAASNVVVVGGERRLRLDDAARAKILTTAGGTELYSKLLREAVVQDQEDHAAVGQDPIRLPSAWLRCFLSGEFTDLDAAPLDELKAASAGRERLRFVRGLPGGVPSVEQMSRRVDLAELLEPLRLLVGAEGGWDGTARRDRFIGRKAELTRLRAFVDELRSESWLEAGSRFVDRAVRSLKATKTPSLMMLYGRGGLGKSTLIAKFLLDHALDQRRPFPFAYLDFDRASLDPLRPRQVLAEIVRQVALQPFPAAQPYLDKLTGDIRASLAAQATGSEEIQDPVARFVEILRDHVTFGQRAFLLVVDTLEIVQWNPKAIGTLVDLIAEFRAKGLDEMRVVASGRADVPEMHPDRPGGESTRDIELKPLVTDEARRLATALGRLAIGRSWEESWSAAIAGTAKDHDMRREPLSVRVAVDLIARTDEARRGSVVADIAQSGTEGADDFVTRLYEKRIVNHVRDPLARKLVWPGLVVRRITSQIASELLAPHCGISEAEAVKAVEALGREVWIVSRADDGALHHRPELRARMLPLMRRRDPKAFTAIARDAVRYFGEHRKRSTEDALEWAYHLLLAGDVPRSIVREVSPDVLSRLRDHVADFSASAASYVTSRTEVSRLSPGKLRKLQPLDALFHLDRTSADAFGFDDRSADLEALQVAQSVDATMVFDEPELGSAARSVWIKTGMWTRLATSFEVEEVRTAPAVRAHAFWAAHAAPATGAFQRTELLNGALRLASPRSAVREGRAGFRTTVQVMALARLTGSDGFAETDSRVAKMLAVMKPNPLPSVQAALRMAIVFGQASRGPALNVWLASRRRGSEDRVRFASMSYFELAALSAMDTDARDRLITLLDEGTPPRRVTDEVILSTAYSALEEVLGQLATNGGLADDVSRMFARRNEDWIVPFGYAAARATQSRQSPAIEERLRWYMGEHPSSSDGVAGVDMVGAVRLADEAGDLPRFVELLAAESNDSQGARDLQFLIDCRNSWSEAVGVLLERGEVEPEPESTVPAGASSKVLPPIADPPPPGPIIHTDDLQKDRWGGRFEGDGRRVRAVIDSVERDTFYFSVTVESTDGTELEAPVIVHLHDSYPRSVVRVRRIVDGRYATLSEWNAFGVFTVGVQVLNGSREWMSLELDLATLPNLPKRFLSR